jgi:hypothetical protein
MHRQNGVVNKDVKIRDLFPEWSVDGCRRTALGLDSALFPGGVLPTEDTALVGIKS